MNISKKQWFMIGIVGVIALWYFFLRKKGTTKEQSMKAIQTPTEQTPVATGNWYSMADENGYRQEGSGNRGLKKCDCTYLGKGPKMCSKSVKCNDCCAGSGGGQE